MTSHDNARFYSAVEDLQPRDEPAADVQGGVVILEGRTREINYGRRRTDSGRRTRTDSGRRTR